MCGYMAVCQNLVPLVNIKIAGKWMFIPLKMVLIGIDPYPYSYIFQYIQSLQLHAISEGLMWGYSGVYSGWRSENLKNGILPLRGS